MSKPIVLINCKTYPQATGDAAVRLAKLCERMAKEHDVAMGIVVQALDLSAVADAVRIPVYAQHVDPVAPGKNTGSITALSLKRAGAKGAILNHSERRMATADIALAVKLLRKEGLTAIVCVESLARLRELVASVKPDFFCLEPPELIAGDVSVSVAQPQVVLQAVHVTSIPMLVGAGVRSYEDIRIAVEMGCSGVLLSSGIVTAPHKERAFAKLLTARAR